MLEEIYFTYYINLLYIIYIINNLGFTSKETRLEAKTRCQPRHFILIRQQVPAVRLIEVDELDETDRGCGGFGSSGSKH